MITDLMISAVILVGLWLSACLSGQQALEKGRGAQRNQLSEAARSAAIVHSFWSGGRSAMNPEEIRAHLIATDSSDPLFLRQSGSSHQIVVSRPGVITLEQQGGL